MITIYDNLNADLHRKVGQVRIYVLPSLLFVVFRGKGFSAFISQSTSTVSFGLFKELWLEIINYNFPLRHWDNVYLICLTALWLNEASSSILFLRFTSVVSIFVLLLILLSLILNRSCFFQLKFWSAFWGHFYISS